MKIRELKNEIARGKKASVRLLALSPTERRLILLNLAKLLAENTERLIAANRLDIREATHSGREESFVERLSLDKKRIASMAKSVRAIANHRDILFETLERRRRPNGLLIKKVRFPLGLLAMIYESRPNVTIDAFALSFKSGNALLLRGGKEIQHTNNVLVTLIRRALRVGHIGPDTIKDFSGLDKMLTLELMRNSLIDCLIPRGGKELISFIKENARIPIIITGASVVHTYVDAGADKRSAVKIVLNAKTRRVSICNALDVLLLHKDISASMLKLLVKDLAKRHVEIRADKDSYRILHTCGYPHLKRAKRNDFDTEFLDYVLAVKVVKDFEQAVQHIQEHGLGHSEAIITRSKKHTAEFFQKIDAACVYVNTSTQFSDGEEFGLGGEIGISTQKLHARGPFATAGLTTYKYLIESNNAIRT